MSLMRLTRTSFTAAAVLSGALALGGASAASAATPAAQTEPKNLYLYAGNGNFVPQVAPAQIYTADGTIIDKESRSRPYGTAGSKYPGWAWSLSPTAASLGWANLNGTKVIQDVIGAGWAPLSRRTPAATTTSAWNTCRSARQQRRELAALEPRERRMGRHAAGSLRRILRKPVRQPPAMK